MELVSQFLQPAQNPEEWSAPTAKLVRKLGCNALTLATTLRAARDRATCGLVDNVVRVGQSASLNNDTGTCAVKTAPSARRTLAESGPGRPRECVERIACLPTSRREY
jgi:hypothetical protein